MIQSVDAAQSSFIAFLPDEGKPGKQAILRRNRSPNAQRYFQAGRKQKDKSAGAIQALRTLN